MDRWVDITFDCLPLRSVGRLDIPIDASPVYRKRCEKIKAALAAHGSHNSYYLHNAQWVYRLTNDPGQGLLEFKFEGVALTDEADQNTLRCDLEVELARETCDWISEPIVKWFAGTVQRAVTVEFDRYIAAGDLKQTVERIEKVRAESDDSGGYVGMYL